MPAQITTPEFYCNRYFARKFHNNLLVKGDTMKTIFLTLGAAMLFTIGSLTTTAYAGPGHDQAEGGHMGHMNDVLQRLKRELGDRYDQPVPAATKDQLALGKRLFAKSCAACHGEGGKGDGPAAVAFKQKPADFTDAEHSKFYSDQGRIYIIKKGSTGTPMSGWEGALNEKEILSVHAYIRSLRKPVNKEKGGHGDHIH